MHLCTQLSDEELLFPTNKTTECTCDVTVLRPLWHPHL